ncbi:MAG: helix-turn-helix transcriptional regulator [Myxococcota bacterium]
MGGPAAAALKALEGEPIDRESIDLQRPGRGLSGTLVRATVDAVLGPAHHRQVYGPAGLTHELSMLVYEGRRFVGRIVAAGARRGFASSAPRYWNSMRASLAEVVREVDVQRRQCLPTSCGMFVIDTTRRVEFATDGAWPWLSHPEFRERFGHIAPPHDGLRLAGEAQVKMTQMTAPGRVGMMVEVAPAVPVTLAPDGALTPTQRRVAEYACEGLTTQQIAKSMQMSVETVRTHMREVYRRLGVASRVELVAKMRLAANG